MWRCGDVERKGRGGRVYAPGAGVGAARAVVMARRA